MKIPDQLLAGGVVGIDVETRDPDLKTLGPGYFRDGILGGVAIKSELRCEYYPLAHNGGNVENPQAFLRQLREEALEYRGILVGHNLRYDLGWLYANAVMFPQARYYCTRTMECLLASDQQSLSLKEVAPRRGLSDKLESPVPIEKILSVPGNEAAEYAKQDAELAVGIFYAHKKHPHFDRAKPAMNLEAKIYKTLFFMSMKGARVDKPYLLEYLDERERAVSDAKGKLRLNSLDSPKALFERLGLESPKRTPKTGKPSYDKEVVAHFAASNPEIKLLYDARVALQEYELARGVLNHLTADSRIHPVYQQEGSRDKENDDSGGARYGRLAATHPNLQQSPKVASYRRMFLPEQGDQWVSADFSQQEPRLCVALACIAGIKKAHGLRDQYAADPNLDVYQAVADAGKIERKLAKIIFLGRIYGMGNDNLFTRLGCTPDEGRKVIAAFNRAVPWVGEFKAMIERSLERRGEGVIFTDLGRPYYFGKGAQDAFAYKALNRLVQGNAAEQTKLAILGLQRGGYNIITTLHDENCVSLRQGEPVEAIGSIMRAPQRRLDEVVPAQVDALVGNDWGEVTE